MYIKRWVTALSSVIILLFLITFLTNINYAKEAVKVYLTSNKDTIKPGEVIEVKLHIEKEKTAAFAVYIYFDNTKWQYISGPENTNVIGNCIIYVWYDIAGGKGAKEGNIGSFEFEAIEEGSNIFQMEGQFYDNEGKELETNFEPLSVSIKGKTEKEESFSITDDVHDITSEVIETTNIDLENLVIEDILLYPPFDASVTHYDIEIPHEITQVNILAVPESEKTAVQIVGNENLQEGKNKIYIILTGEDQVSKKIYEIDSYRRNVIEENTFQEQKKQNAEKLKEIYKIEKTGIDGEKGNDQAVYLQNEKNSIFDSKIKKWIVMVGIIFICFILYKRKKYKT